MVLLGNVAAVKQMQLAVGHILLVRSNGGRDDHTDRNVELQLEKPQL